MLNSTLAFVAIIAKIFFCALADRHRAYRTFFIFFLMSALVGFGSFGVLPFFIAPQPKQLGINIFTWTIICIMTTIAAISQAVLTCLSDAFAMNSSKKNDISYGMIRVWGTIGWGVSSLLLAFINQIDKLPLLVPGLLTTIAFIAIDIIFASTWPNNEDFKLDMSSSNIDVQDVVLAIPRSKRINLEEEKLNDNQQSHVIYGTNDIKIDSSLVNITVEHARQDSQQNVSGASLQWLLFKEVASKRRSLYRYMMLFTISGALISLQWSYFFLYLKNIYEADFTFISGLSMVAQSMVGELPFFILSKIIIQKIGRSHTLSISIMSIGIRYLMYRYLLPGASMYFVILTEAFQGPNFGLFYVVMTEIGLDYSDCEEAIVHVVQQGIVANNPEQIQKLRQSLRATMQSIMSACYESLGVGIGSILGGLIIDLYGFDQLWVWASTTSIVLGLANFLIDITGFPILVDRKTHLVLPVN